MSHRITARQIRPHRQRRTVGAYGNLARTLGWERLESRWLLAGDTDDQFSEATGLGNFSNRDVGNVVTGAISPASDVDMYLLLPWPGLTLDFDIDTVENGPGGLDSYLRLFDSKGKQLAASNNAANPDEDSLGFDAFIRYTFSSGNRVYLGISNANNISYDPITGEGDLSSGTSAVGDYKLMLRMAGDSPDAGDVLRKADHFFSYADNYTVRGRIEHDTDVDLYEVVIGNKVTVDFDVDTFASEVGGLTPYLRLFLYNGQEVSIKTETLAPGDSKVSNDPYLRYYFPVGGTCYVGISNASHTKYDVNGIAETPVGANAAGYYSLRIYEFSNDFDDKYYYSESLREVTTAPLVRDRIIEVDLDVDVYSFIAEQGQTVDFDIDTPRNGIGSVDSYLRLFNGSQELAANDGAVAPGEKSLGFDAYLRYTFNTPGKYYIAVSNKHNIQYDPETGDGDTAGGLHSAGEYKLTLTQLVTTPIDLDDTLDEARSFYSLRNTLPYEPSGVIHQDIDVDMYSYDLMQGGQTVYFYVTQFTQFAVNLGFQMRLFDASGQQLVHSSGNPFSTFTNILRYRFENAGRYYLGVSARNNIAYDPKTGIGDTIGASTDVGGYRLSAGILEVDTDDELQEATPFPALTNDLQRKYAAIGIDVDVDMFRIEAMAGQVVDIDIDTDGNGRELNTFLRVFSAVGIELASNDNGLAPDDTWYYDTPEGTDSYLRYTFPSTGAYYIGVSNAANKTYNAIDGGGDTAGGAKNSGTFNLDIRSVTLVNSDTDDTLSEAVSIQEVTGSPTTVNNDIDRNSDVDMYRFSVAAGQRVNFDIDTVLTSLFSHLRLFNTSGVELASNSLSPAPGETLSGFDSFLQYTFAAAGTYYLGVSTYYNTTYDAVTGEDHPLPYGYSFGSYTLIVQTDGPPPVAALTLSVDKTAIPEINGVATGTITRVNSSLTETLIVNINVTDNNAVNVPTAIAIPAGQASINFSIIGIHDLAQGTRDASITVSSARLAPVSKTMKVTDSDGPGHNGNLPEDTNADGSVTPMDALLVVNYLNVTGGGPVPLTLENFLDVSADGQITPIDALFVIGRLNGSSSGEGEGAVSDHSSAELVPTSTELPTFALNPAASINRLRSRRWQDSVDGFFADVG